MGLRDSAPSLRLPSHNRNNIVYVRDEESLRAFLADIQDIKTLALDIETASPRGGYWVENGAPRTIQLGGQTKNWYKRAAVVDLMHVEANPLFAPLRDPEVEIVIQNADYECLWLDYHFGVKITNIFDTKVAGRIVRRERAKELGVKVTSLHDLNLASLAKEYAREEVDKTEQASWWGRPELEPGQIIYAAKDVDIPLLIARRLKAYAEHYGVLDEIRDECDKIYPRNHKQVLRMGDGKDDYPVAKLILENSLTEDELDQAYWAIQGLPLHHKNRRKIKQIYRSRKSVLKRQ
jgi:ribonuclease D